MRSLLAVLVGVGALVVTVPAATAGVGVGVAPNFSNGTVGQTGVPGSLAVSNGSTGPEANGNFTVSSINLVPACGTSASVGNGDCPAASADPGVFQLSPTGTGETGTACAGRSFTIAIVDPATGQVSFTPVGSLVLDAPAGPHHACVIDFSFSVLKMPTHPFSIPGPNQARTVQIGFAAGTAAVNGAVGSGTGTGSNTVTKATPSLTTTATAAGALGSPITDTATLSAGVAPGPAPTGTITFNVFDNANCVGARFPSTVPVTSGAGTYSSAPFVPGVPGTYRWTATYSGDANTAPMSTMCDDPGETTIVKASPTIATTTSVGVQAGGFILDSAVLAGGFAATGDITFTAFGPDNPGCNGLPTFTSTSHVNGDGTYFSDPFPVTLVGDYEFVASYGGDGANSAFTSPCGAPNERATVVKNTGTSVRTTASPSQPVGSLIVDRATLPGAVNPTGSIATSLFGPADPGCHGTPVYTTTISVDPDAASREFVIGAFTPTLPAAYQWVAVYSGDANNVGATSLCGAFNESVVVTAAPAIVTQASPSVTIGNPISDSATLSGGSAPTGTIAFKVFGPDDTGCGNGPVFTASPTVADNGNYTSGPFTPTVVGTYRFIVVYSGDANNAGATSPCNATNESVVVTRASPTVSTQASGGNLLGAPVRDTAALAGGLSPTGTVTFALFSDAGCGTQVFASTNAVSATSATSGWFTPSAAGTYRWTATYSGDANNGPASSACNAPNESVVIAPFAPPPPTRVITGDLVGPVTVNAGESVQLTGARVVGPVTVNPGGSLDVVNSQISRGITANAPGFFRLCGAQVSGPSPAQALAVSNAAVPIRIGDPATGCAGNRFAGDVNLTSNLAVSFGANIVSNNVNVNTNGPGTTVIKADNVFQTLACAGNSPPPVNAGQPDTAGAKTGQCAAL